MKNTSNKTTTKILEIIFKRRKLIDSQSQDTIPFSSLSAEETQLHLLKIEKMVLANQPIHMILPAYPGKSPNRNKTLSKLPDLAEKHSLDNLSELCQEITEIYPPGATIRLCSDGYVFSDLVRIPDQDVHAYTEAIKDYYQEHYPNYFGFFDIKDAFPQLTCLDSMREELMIHYGESLIHLKEKSKTEKETLSMYKGITKFLYEDFCGLDEFANQSKTQIQKRAKQISIRVIQRSNAWSQLLADTYPEALRLSIHPQFRESLKIGINMGKSDDVWRTPWHSVAVLKNQEILLQKRSLVDENKHRLIFNSGKPSHYQELSILKEEAVRA